MNLNSKSSANSPKKPFWKSVADTLQSVGPSSNSPKPKSSTSKPKQPSSATEKREPPPTAGLRSPKKPAARSGKRMGTSMGASIKPHDFGNKDNLAVLREMTKPLTEGKRPPLTWKDDVLVREQLLSLENNADAIQVLQEAVTYMVVKNEYTIARYLLAMCDTSTRTAMFQQLPSDAFKAMLENSNEGEQRRIVHLLHKTVERAISKGQYELASPLLRYLAPAKQAEYLLMLPDTEPAPQPFAVAKAPAVLSRTGIDEETWNMLGVQLEVVAGTQLDAQSQPILTIDPKQISVSIPLNASREVSLAFSQAVAYLVVLGHQAQACHLLSMCGPVARAYVFQALMRDAPESMKELEASESQEVKALFEDAAAGCLAGASDLSDSDRQTLQATLDTLEKYRSKPLASEASVSPDRVRQFWQAFAACSPSERKELLWRVPTAFHVKAAALDIAGLPTEVRQDIDYAFEHSAGAGLKACERWLAQQQELASTDPAKALVLAWTVSGALCANAPQASWTNEQASLHGALAQQNTGEDTLAMLRKMPPADHQQVLLAVVDQAANAPMPGGLPLLQQLVDCCVSLRDDRSEDLAQCKLFLGDYLAQAVAGLLQTHDSFKDKDLRTHIKALNVQLDRGQSKRFEDALRSMELGTAADVVCEMFAADNPQAAGCFERLVTAVRNNLERVGLKLDMGLAGMAVMPVDASSAARLAAQHVQVEHAVMVMELCGNGDVQPFLPALRNWMVANPMDRSALSPEHARSIESYQARARAAADGGLAFWTVDCGSLSEARHWMGELQQLRQPHTDADAKAIVSRMEEGGFVAWMTSLLKADGAPPAVAERFVLDILCSEHCDVHTMEWMITRFAPHIDIEKALTRVPVADRSGLRPSGGAERLLTLAQNLSRFSVAKRLPQLGDFGAGWLALDAVIQATVSNTKTIEQEDKSTKSVVFLYDLSLELNDGVAGGKLLRKAWEVSLVHGLPCSSLLHCEMVSRTWAPRMRAMWSEQQLAQWAKQLKPYVHEGNGDDAAVKKQLLHNLMRAVVNGSHMSALVKLAHDMGNRFGSDKKFAIDFDWLPASVSVFQERLSQVKDGVLSTKDKDLLENMVYFWQQAFRAKEQWLDALTPDDKAWVKQMLGLASNLSAAHQSLSADELSKLERVALERAEQLQANAKGQ